MFLVDVGVNRFIYGIYIYISIIYTHLFCWVQQIQKKVLIWEMLQVLIWEMTWCFLEGEKFFFLGACFSIKAFVSIDFPATASVCPGNRSLLSCSQVLRSLPRAPKSLPHGLALKSLPRGRAPKSLPRCRVLKSLFRCRVLKSQLVQLEKLHC